MAICFLSIIQQAFVQRILGLSACWVILQLQQRRTPTIAPWFYGTSSFLIIALQHQLVRSLASSTGWWHADEYIVKIDWFCPPVNQLMRDLHCLMGEQQSLVLFSQSSIFYKSIILHHGTLQYTWHSSHGNISGDSDYWEAIMFRFLFIGALLFRCMSKPLPPYNILKALVILNVAVPPKRWLCLSNFLWFGLWGGSSMRIENLAFFKIYLHLFSVKFRNGALSRYGENRKSFVAPQVVSRTLGVYLF